MADPRRKTCRLCGKHASEVGPITWGGYCIEHGLAVKESNARQLHAHNGPAFKHWRERTIAALGAVPSEKVAS